MSVKHINEYQLQTPQVAEKAAAVIVNGDTLFTVSNGPILIEEVIAVCITANNATASTLQYSANGTDGAAATISGASASLANAASGTIVATVPGDLTTAPAIYTNGIGIAGTVGIIVPAGIITAVVGVGSTTGTWKFSIRYRPLFSNVVVA